MELRKGLGLCFTAPMHIYIYIFVFTHTLLVNTVEVEEEPDGCNFNNWG